MKIKSMKVEQRVNIHNRFDIEVHDALTGELKQRLYAENIILNAMWGILANRDAYFSYIQFGTGTGTLSASRTNLFTPLGYKTAVNDVQSKALPTSSWRQKIVLNPEEYVGSVLSEVGIAYGWPNMLLTHAMLRDMNGNVITLTKTALDVITIYGTVYVTFSTSNANLALTGMPNLNPLVNYLVGGDTMLHNQGFYFQIGEAPVPNDSNISTLVVSTVLFSTATIAFTADVGNKKFSTDVKRLAVGESNGHITEIGLGCWITPNPICRLLLPAEGIYSGLDLVGIAVGTGDGNTVDFLLPSKNIVAASVVVKVDGTETAVTKTAVNKAINFKQEARTDTDIYKLDVSDDGSVIALVKSTSMTSVYLYDVSNDFISLLELKSLAFGNINDVALSSDGNILVLCLSNTPYVATYARSGDAWVARATPGTILNRPCYTVAISRDGLVMACGGSDQNGTVDIKSYDWVGSAWVVRATPPSMVRGINKLALDADGNVLAATFAYYDDTAVICWDWSGSAWVKRANPPSLPTGGQGYSACLSNNGSVLGITNSGAAIVWDWGGSSWTIRATAPSLPSTSYHNMHLSLDGNFMICGTNLYDWVSNAWVLRTGGKVYTATNPHMARETMNIFVAVNGAYDIANRSLKVTFDTAPATGAVITADYTVNGIHKTTQRVVDLQAVITFGEPV